MQSTFSPLIYFAGRIPEIGYLGIIGNELFFSLHRSLEPLPAGRYTANNY